MTLKPVPIFWSIGGDFIYRHHNEPRVQLYVPKEETFPIPLKYIKCFEVHTSRWVCVARKEDWRLLESIRMSICQMILGEGSQNSLYWKRSLQKDTCGPGGDWRRFKRHPDQIMFGQKYGRKLVKPLRIEKNRNGQKKSQNWQCSITERNLLYWSRRRRIQRNSQRCVAPGMSCRRMLHPSITKVMQSNGKEKEFKTKYGCVVESHESTRQRAESLQSKIHEDRIAGKEFTSVTHYNLVHKFITRPQAMKIPGAKAAVDKEWEKLGRRQHMKSNLRSWGKQYKQNITCKFILSFDHARVSWISCEWWETTPTRAGTCAEFRSCGRWQTISALDVLYEMDGTKKSLHQRSVGLVSRRRCRRSQEKRIE